MDCEDKNTGKKVRSTFLQCGPRTPNGRDRPLSPSQRTVVKVESVGHGIGELKTSSCWEP